MTRPYQEVANAVVELSRLENAPEVNSKEEKKDAK